MSDRTQVAEYDESIVGIIIGAMLLFCLVTLAILLGIF